MAIFPSRTRPIAGARQLSAAPANAHTRSLLAQASRNDRLNNIGSVQALLTAHAGSVRGGKGGGGNRGGRK